MSLLTTLYLHRSAGHLRVYMGKMVVNFGQHKKAEAESWPNFRENFYLSIRDECSRFVRITWPLLSSFLKSSYYVKYYVDDGNQVHRVSSVTSIISRNVCDLSKVAVVMMWINVLEQTTCLEQVRFCCIEVTTMSYLSNGNGRLENFFIVVTTSLFIRRISYE